MLLSLITSVEVCCVLGVVRRDDLQIVPTTSQNTSPHHPYQTIFSLYPHESHPRQRFSFCLAIEQFSLLSCLYKSYDMPLLFCLDQFCNSDRLPDFQQQGSTTGRLNRHNLHL